MTKITTPEQFLAINKAQLETLLSLANSALARAERLTELNLNTTRSVLEDGVAITRKLAEAKTPQELASLQAELTQPMLDKAVAYARNVQELAAEGQQETAKLVESQVAELNSAFSTALEQAAKTAPAGSEAFFAAVKSAMDTANGLYENVSSAAKLAEAKLAAATEQAVEAVTASVKSATPKKRA
ncbi:MAG TPA: phasin family protein [Thauera sp.]|nr:phasin family protein [Thauera sp.]